MVLNGEIVQLRILGEGMGAEIGSAVLFELEGENYVPLHDHRGSVIALLGCETYRYTAFGEALTDSELSPWRFLSKRFDSETGLIYFGRRYYSPALGRWLTPDPLSFRDGPNLYAYVSNRPLDEIDPFGLWRHTLGRGLDRATDCMRSAGRMLFRGIEGVGKHLIPLGGIRDVVEGIGRFCSGGKLFEKAEYRKNQNQIVHIDGVELEHMSVVYVNGMLTNRNPASDVGKTISITHGGVAVDVLYNGSEGMSVDALAAVAAKAGLNMDVERMLANYFIEKLKKDPQHQFGVLPIAKGAPTHITRAGSSSPQIAPI